MKNHTDEKEATEQLRKAGWTAPEIERLRQVRRAYVAQKGGQTEAFRRRPALVRWLAALLQQGCWLSAPW